MTNLTHEVDKLFSNWAKNDSPGCAIAVVKDHEIVYSQGYGLANLEYGVPNTPDTIFHIASVSKHFTCMAVLLLEAQGKLSIEDDYRKYLPEMPDFGTLVTIRHLMHHTSGIRDQWELLMHSGWRMDDVITTDDIRGLLEKQTDLNFPPGEQYLYSNSGFTLLALIVERVSGKSLREFCQGNIFKPLSMNSTHFHDDHTMLVKNRSYSYAPDGQGNFKNAVLSYANVGATSLFTTVNDLARWDGNFYNPRVGSQAVIEKMLTTTSLTTGKPNNYALGLMIGKYRGLNIVEHSGGDAGYRTHYLRFPDQRFSVIIFCNLGTMVPGQLTRQVADLYLADSFTLPAEEPAEPITLSAEQLQQYAGTFYDPVTQSSRVFEIKDGKLQLALEKQFEFIPLPEHRFRMKDSPLYVIQFSDLQDGHMGQMVLQPESAAYTYRRVETDFQESFDYQALSGTYFSPELEVEYRVIVKNNEPFIVRRKYGTTPLKHAFGDTFINDLSCLTGSPYTINIHFKRDDSGNISGFELASGRIRSLWFKHLS